METQFLNFDFYKSQKDESTKEQLLRQNKSGRNIFLFLVSTTKSSSVEIGMETTF
jgi:hypothetical protein